MNTPRSLVLLAIAAAAAACARHEGGVASATTGSTPRFETRSEHLTESGTHSDFFCADFDHDGDTDMAVISLTGELRVLFGNGTTWNVVQRESVADAPIWMAGADFNGDSFVDIVIVRNAAQVAETWRNDGTGTFVRDQQLSLPIVAALSVVTGDVDRDGNQDIIVSVPLAPQLKIFYGAGNGTFPQTQELALPGGGQPFTVQIGDVTRDGLVDLVASDNILSRVVVFEGVQQGSFGSVGFELSIPGFPIATSIGDLSGDGNADICVSAFLGNRFTVVTETFPSIGKVTLDGTDGAGFFETREYSSFDVTVPDKPLLSAIADVTGDGRADLIATLAFRASVVVAPQLPAGGISDEDTTKQFFDSTGSGNPLRPFVADIDKNGKNDLLVLSGVGQRACLWLANDEGRLLGSRNFDPTLPGASWMVGGDFDGDGDNEVVAGSDNNPGLAVLGSGSNPALGNLVLEATFSAGVPVRQLEAADLDVDGRLDLIVSTPGGVKVLRNTSTGSGYAFATPAGTPDVLGSGDQPFGATAGDFDRDGNMDIAWCDFGGGLHIVRGTNTAWTFLPELVLQLGGKPIDVVAADFTGDGRLDLAVSREDAADIAILRNITPTSGLGPTDLGFEEFLNVPVGNSPNYLVTADFNRDGRADLVVSNGDSASVSVLFGSASGFVGQQFPAGTGPTALLARDLTNDGFADILVASLVSGEFRILVGDGAGGFPQLPSFPGTWGASNAVLQDMTRDGRPDLMISSLVTRRISLVRNISTD